MRRMSGDGQKSPGPERWRQIESVLSAALERTPGERDAFLSEACGDDQELRREVESLLAGEFATSTLLERPLADLLTSASAPIPAQTLLGNYRILEPIGSGGMGQVYRARDERLGRIVAIKILPPSLSADAERRHRFLHEARAASALQHPNIVTFHDLATAEGQDFLVMEYVAGTTLDRVIPNHGLPFSQALSFAIQIADGLEATHSALIVHRDLKPSNIMVTETSQIKLLDFGVAKLVEPARDAPAGPSLTKTGMIVGTAAYMSPEQAEGRKVDARSDIFSFGAVLYEMLTGRRLFQRESAPATLAAVVHDDPPLVSEVVAGTPPEVDRILRSCLRKDPLRRIQHMADVKVALQDLKEDSDSGRLRPPAPISRRQWRWWVLAAGVLLTLIAGGVTWRMTRSTGPPAPPILTRLTNDTGLTTDPALSPDGKLLAFASDRAGADNLDIWVKQVGGSEPIRLTQSVANENEPSFSPDGTSIVYRS
ncbi:MAG: serine/threonine-protein kinase, partial [Bryobacterales bacterium]|nr:serine/threonine-protein kinase [Bryobacterales bacterium]